MGLIDSVLRRNKELETLFDLDLTDETIHRAYLKKMALETCLNFIGRTISQSEFRMVKENKRVFNDWDYLLNVRPNTDQSAADFWHSFIYRLIDENEILVVLTDDNNLLMADSFTRDEYAIYPDVFREVTVKDYMFKRTFRMDEVIYITYNNEKLTRFMDGLFSDYADLFSRMLEISLRKNQIRGTVGIDSTQSLDTESQTKLQNFINKLFNSFRKNSVALVPKLKGFEYDEVANGEGSGQSVEELAKVKKSLIDDIANILGIPNALIHGELAEYDTSIKAYIKFCIDPLVKKVKDELNAKLLSKEEYQQGFKLEVRGIAELNPLELADAVDKLRASGVYNGNEIRVKLGDEPKDIPSLEEYVLTKNYESKDTDKGGENE
ncbi:phage portal protein [Bacillus sp. VT 712]|uniref:phage portal protein n=1 Tax=Bacillaceae TaxID=186817 RepID=UPI00047429F8|nr:MULTISPECIES: phage portal protein [Bacillaceae]KZB89932.1 phage portal protein [Bacillus sp. VT 712]MCG7314138.1 phage portal protein [Priestia flexa]